MTATACRLVLLLALLGSSLAGYAAGLDPDDPRIVGQRPGAGGPPTEIYLNLYIFDVDEINDISQAFGLDFFVSVEWRDERLALTGDERSGIPRTRPLTEMWTPRVLIVNDRGLKYHLPRIAEVDDDGNVLVQQRVSGKLSTDLEFREFPFDAQLLPVEIISYQYSPDEVVFRTDSTVTGANKFAAEGWDLSILAPSYELFEVPATRSKRPQFTVLLEAERQTKYYLLTMFLPMSLIVFMSWTVFWLQPDIVPARVSIATASIFSLMAFGFSIRLSLPKVSYMTRADLFVMGCTLMVFLALGVAAISSRWVNSDRMALALRANVFMRWTYVLLYALVIVVALTV